MRKMIDKDLSSLGEREVEYVEVGTKADVNGLMQMHTYKRKRMQAQGILTEEESKRIPADCWSESPDCFKGYGSHYANVNGRRFFTDHPTQEPKTPNEKSGKDTKSAQAGRNTTKKAEGKKSGRAKS